MQIILVLGIAGGIGGSRVIRGAVIGIKENDYFLAARAIGSPTTATLMRHVLPNIMPVIIIIFSISVGGVIILAEASLSFLGFGLPPRFLTGEVCSAAKDVSTWRWRHGWLSGPVLP